MFGFLLVHTESVETLHFTHSTQVPLSAASRVFSDERAVWKTTKVLIAHPPGKPCNIYMCHYKSCIVGPLVDLAPCLTVPQPYRPAKSCQKACHDASVPFENGPFCFMLSGIVSFLLLCCFSPSHSMPFETIQNLQNHLPEFNTMGNETKTRNTTQNCSKTFKIIYTAVICNSAASKCGLGKCVG